MIRKLGSLTVVFVMTLIIHGNSYCDTIKAAGIFYCPYTCDVNKDGQEGFMIDIAKTVFKNAGHTYVVTIFPFMRALEVGKKWDI